jgi:hypothetical protein
MTKLRQRPEPPFEGEMREFYKSFGISDVVTEAAIKARIKNLEAQDAPHSNKAIKKQSGKKRPVRSK